MKVGTLNFGVACAATVLALGAGSADAATNLFVNGSFEAGNFSGWKLVDNGFSDIPAVVGTVDGVSPEDGKFQASMTGSGSRIVQTITDTAGEQISFSFWYMSSDPGGQFNMIFNGTTYPVLIGGQSSYQKFSFTFPFAATGSEIVQIVSDAQPGEFLRVDNFSIVPVVGVSPGVPEVSTWAMMLVGFASMGVAYALSARARRSAHWRGFPRLRPHGM